VADAPSNIPLSHLPSGAVRIVGDVMRTDIPTVRLDENLASIVEKFVTGDTHRLVVIDEAGLAVGLIADSDVVERVQPEHRGGILDAFRNIGKPPVGKETAADIMSTGVISILPGTSIMDAASKMLAESRKWLVVINETGLPIGLVDRQTLLEALVSIPTSK
jgi:predicted transcriptional regulator